jgi:hypothetical protein
VSDIPIKTDEDVMRTLLKLLHAYNERFGRIHATLVAHRKAIAAAYPDPVTAEAQLLQLEAEAQDLVLEGQGFPEAAAFAALLEARKSPDKLDS